MPVFGVKAPPFWRAI